MRIDRPSSIALFMFAIFAIALALLLPWQCARGQSTGTAGEFSLTFQYSKIVDQQLTEQYGKNWRDVISAEMREHWKNVKSTAKETYEKNRAALFSVDDPAILTAAEQRKLIELADTARIRIERKRALEAEAAKLPETP